MTSDHIMPHSKSVNADKCEGPTEKGNGLVNIGDGPSEVAWPGLSMIITDTYSLG